MCFGSPDMPDMPPPPPPAPPKPQKSATTYTSAVATFGSQKAKGKKGTGAYTNPRPPINVA